jgi:hypothetical protein
MKCLRLFALWDNWNDCTCCTMAYGNSKKMTIMCLLFNWEHKTKTNSWEGKIIYDNKRI